VTELKLVFLRAEQRLQDDSIGDGIKWTGGDKRLAPKF
jgi:hypothetical protein